MKTRFLRDVSLIIWAEATAGITGLIYIMVISRRLGVADYGLFQAFMGFYGILMIFGVPLNLAVSHCVASSENTSKKIIAGTCVRASFLLGASCAVMISICAQPISRLLRSPSILPVICMAGLTVARATILGFYGVLQGNNKYVPYAIARAVEPIVCLVCGITLVIAGAGVTGVLGGYLAGMFFVLMIFMSQRNLYGEFSGGKLTLLLKEFRAICSILLVFAVLFFVGDFPSVLARVKLSDEMSGRYASLYTLRHTILPFCSAVCYPLYSYTVSRSPEKKILLKALITVSLLGTGFLIISKLCPSLVFRVLYGSEFVEGARYMFAYGIALCLQMVVMTLMLHRAAINKLSRPLLLIPIAAFSVYLLSRKPMIENLIYSQSAAWITLLVCAAAWRVLSALLHKKPRDV